MDLSLNPNFYDMLSALCAEDVEFLLVGAYAVAVHAVPRATYDLDLWVRPSAENAQRVLRALDAFGAPLLDLTAGDLTRPGLIFQLGVQPERIDIITSIDGVEFDDAWPARISVKVGQLDVPVIGRAHLLQNKKATGRTKDALDVLLLEENAGR